MKSLGCNQLQIQVDTQYLVDILDNTNHIISNNMMIEIQKSKIY